MTAMTLRLLIYNPTRVHCDGVSKDLKTATQSYFLCLPTLLPLTSCGGMSNLAVASLLKGYVVSTFIEGDLCVVPPYGGTSSLL